MTLSVDLLRDMARELLGHKVDEATLTEVASRLGGLVDRVRNLDEHRMIGLEPAGTFDAGHPEWTRERPGKAAWAGLTSSQPGGSGYPVPQPNAAPDSGRSYGTHGTTDPAGPGADLCYLSAVEAADLIRRRELSPVELTCAVLERIAALNPRLNSYITVTAEAAMTAARAAEEAVGRGEPLGPLHGIPLAVKDLFSTAGVRTTGGSKILGDWVPEEDATSVALLRAAGAILVGKTNTHEFAYGGTNNNQFYGPARNPWDLQRIPGGSSGGSAAAVAGGMAHIALGSDTAASIRLPATACGVVGFKPTYGRVSKYGVLPLAWSMDTVGPLTRTVADAALVLGALAGPDSRDHTAVSLPVPDYLAAAQNGARGLKGLRIGVPRQWLEARIEDEVRQGCLDALDVMAGLGAQICEVTLPSPDEMMTVNRLIVLAEASAYHAPYLKEQPENYSQEVRLRLGMGEFLLARDYIAGQRLRGELCQRMATVMTDVDVIVIPTMPMRAPLIGQEAWDWNGRPDSVAELLIRLTSPINVTGNPAIAVPCGFPGGLPVGIQIVGRPFAEETVLTVAAAYEGAAGWHLSRPAI